MAPALQNNNMNINEWASSLLQLTADTQLFCSRTCAPRTHLASSSCSIAKLWCHTIRCAIWCVVWQWHQYLIVLCTISQRHRYAEQSYDIFSRKHFHHNFLWNGSINLVRFVPLKETNKQTIKIASEYYDCTEIAKIWSRFTKWYLSCTNLRKDDPSR